MNCPYIPDLPYSDFRSRMREKLGAQRLPLSGSFELTFRCNSRCQHCYVAYGHDGIPGKQELSYAEVTRILDELVEAGCLWLLLTGGEVLMREDFSAIYLYAKRKGLLISLFTNATMLTSRVVDLLDEYRPFNLEITLYGWSQETYERVTGIPGSHQRCYTGIQRLVERGIPFRLKTVLMTLNAHELKAMQAFAAGLGAAFRYDALINHGLDGCGKPLNLRLPASQVIQIEQNDPGLAVVYQQFTTRYRDWKHDGHRYQCGAGRNSFHIDPYGQLTMCMMARHAAYNLRSGSFKEGWDQFLLAERSRLMPEEHICRQCALQPICSACPGWAYIEHGDPDAYVRYLCEVTHLRAEAFHLNHQLVMTQQVFENQEVEK